MLSGRFQTNELCSASGPNPGGGGERVKTVAGTLISNILIKGWKAAER